MKPCCENQERREVVEDKPGLRVEVCTVCGCRHFEVTADPGVIGLKVASL